MNYKEKDVKNAMHNNKIAFENLYRDINTDLYKMALYVLGNSQIAEEVVSDTVLDALTGITKLKDETRFEAWILKMLTNKCKRRMKENYNKFSVFNPNAQDFDDSLNEQLCQEKDIDVKTDIQIALSKLQPKDRMIVTLCVVEGYKSREVAAVLSMKPTTVRSRLNRSLAKMRGYLEVKE
ncbi:MAG: RNA polymerase sigma factor [Eubacterium sp.]|nr:RNA polymerase sigma factor [Eubacterium sp.]